MTKLNIVTLTILSAILLIGGALINFNNKFELPASCTTYFIIKYNDSDDSVLSSGQFFMNYDKNNSAIGIYTGDIFFYKENHLFRSERVNRTLEFTYSMKGNVLVLKTLNATKNTNDTTSDFNASAFITPAFVPNTTTYHTIIKLSRGRYATGDGKFPKLICLTK